MNRLDLTGRPAHCFVCGDIHADFEALAKMAGERRIAGATIIVAGDCGFGFERPEYYERLYWEKLHPVLAPSDVLLLMVRGNHDDPAYFEMKMMGYPCMKLLPDYTVVCLPRHNVLCAGGAVSMDRRIRLEQMALVPDPDRPLYWPDETFTFRPEEVDALGCMGISVDTVVTHSSPDFCPPREKAALASFCTHDDRLRADVTKERRDLSALYEALIARHHPLRNWYFGHFHYSQTFRHGATTFHMLAIKELLEMPIDDAADV